MNAPSSTLRHETLADGLAFTFDDRGTGPAVLVLHGGGGPLTVAGFVAAMSADARVIAPLHPGFAGTPRPESFDSVEQIADAYARLLERLALTDVLVIGFSIGGWIANALALRAPDRVRGLVLVNGAGIVVEGEPCADVFSLTPQQLSALSYHDPARYGIDPARLSDAQKAGMAANMQTLAVYGRGRDMGDRGPARAPGQRARAGAGRVGRERPRGHARLRPSGGGGVSARAPRDHRGVRTHASDRAAGAAAVARIDDALRPS